MKSSTRLCTTSSNLKVSDLHADALGVLSQWSAPNPDQEQLRSDYVATLLAHADATQRSGYPGHLTASCLVLSADHREVLLMLHAKAQQWFQMGGHIEPSDLTLAAAALREATEESGIEGLGLDPVPVHLDRHDVGFCHPKGVVAHLDVRFVAIAPPGAIPAQTAESSDLAWFPIDRLPTQEPGIVELVRFAVGRAT